MTRSFYLNNHPPSTSPSFPNKSSIHSLCVSSIYSHLIIISPKTVVKMESCQITNNYHYVTSSFKFNSPTPHVQEHSNGIIGAWKNYSSTHSRSPKLEQQNRKRKGSSIKTQWGCETCTLCVCQTPSLRGRGGTLDGGGAWNKWKVEFEFRQRGCSACELLDECFSPLLWYVSLPHTFPYTQVYLPAIKHRLARTQGRTWCK